MPGCLDHESTLAANKLTLLVEEVLVVLPVGFPGRREKTSRLKQTISIRYGRDTESTESHRLEWCGHHHACVPFMSEKRRTTRAVFLHLSHRTSSESLS